jgi:hypothetical protein
MYKVKRTKFIVEDTRYNIEKILDHPDILIMNFGIKELWSTFRRNETYDNDFFSHALPENKIFVFVDCYIKLKHTRRYKETSAYWTVTAKQVLAVVK